MGKGQLHIYDVIRRPVITEKSHVMVDIGNQYVFEVEQRANKVQIKEGGAATPSGAPCPNFSGWRENAVSRP